MIRSLAYFCYEMASGSCDNTIKIWNTKTGQLIKTLEGHKDTVYCLLLLPNGQITSGSYDTTIKICNPETDQLIRTWATLEIDLAADVIILSFTVNIFC
jgi:WD40 repeat protein